MRDVVLYFNSWGATRDQALYVQKAFADGVNRFYAFTFQLSDIGGADLNNLPPTGSVQDPTFVSVATSQFHKLLTQMVNSVEAILSECPCRRVVMISHSLGFTTLFYALDNCSLKRNTSRLRKIILLDPAGTGSTPEEVEANITDYGTFMQRFNNFRTSTSGDVSSEVYASWKTYNASYSSTLFTPQESVTGMAQYISDCTDNSQLDLCLYAYAIEFYPVAAVISRYARTRPWLVTLLTSTNGLAYKKLNLWRGLGVTDIRVVGDCGHFLHIFSQVDTIAVMRRVLDLPPAVVIPYGTAYNAPVAGIGNLHNHLLRAASGGRRAINDNRRDR